MKIVGSVLLVWLWNIEGAILTAVLSSTVYAVTLYLKYLRFVRTASPTPDGEIANDQNVNQ